MVPMQLRFDGQANVDGGSIVHFPKLNHGAPYRFSLRVRLEDDTYRVWDAPKIRWRIKLRPADKAELLVLTLTNGNFEVDGDDLVFIIKATDWTDIVLPVSPNHLEMDAAFAHVVEFLDAEDVVTERFAQGSGLITSSLDF